MIKIDKNIVIGANKLFLNNTTITLNRVINNFNFKLSACLSICKYDKIKLENQLYFLIYKFKESLNGILFSTNGRNYRTYIQKFL